MDTSSSSLVIVITGGSSGLGRLATQRFLSSGHTVVFTGRTQQNVDNARQWILYGVPVSCQAEAASRLHGFVLDFGSSLESIQQTVKHVIALQLPPVDVLFNNAGGIYPTLQFAPDTQTVERTLFANAVAPWYFTRLMLPLLRRPQQQQRDGGGGGGGARILFVTSSLHDEKVKGSGTTTATLMTEHDIFANLDGHEAYEGRGFYRISKLVIFWLGLPLARELQDSGITVNIFDPGLVPTTSLSRDMPWLVHTVFAFFATRFMSIVVPEEECVGYYEYYATSCELQGITGHYFRHGERCASSAWSRDADKQHRFWNIACDICKCPERRMA